MQTNLAWHLYEVSLTSSSQFPELRLQVRKAYPDRCSRNDFANFQTIEDEKSVGSIYEPMHCWKHSQKDALFSQRMFVREQVLLEQASYQTFLWRGRVYLSLNNLLFSTVQSLLVMCNSVAKTYIKCTFASDASTSKRQAESFLNPTILRRSGRCKYDFAVPKVPAQVSSLVCRALRKLNTRFIFHSTNFCSCLSSIVIPE